MTAKAGYRTARNGSYGFERSLRTATAPWTSKKQRLALQPFKFDETMTASVSADLKNWKPMLLAAGTEIVMDFKPGTEIRYVRFEGTPDKVV